MDAPRQDWAEYERRVRPLDAAWNRSLTPAQRFDIYEDLFTVVMAARQADGDWERLEAWRWQEKLARRQCEVAAYQKLDQLRRERTNSSDAC